MSSDSVETVGNNEDVDKCVPSTQKDNLSIQERFGEHEIFQRPMCLVSADNEMNLIIIQDVLNQISLIDVPISVVGICGVCRTGKSYLMNLLAAEEKGFPVGNYTDPKTKGIWAWCKPHTTIRDRVVIFLDTEGFSSANKCNTEHDAKLFCLTMLMSSVLIYNMNGVINSDALERLSVITKITEKVCIDGSNCSVEDEENEAFQIISPVFILCLRDYFLQSGGKTPDQYMESCLEESLNTDNVVFNTTRRSIKAFFPSRKCFTLAQPGINEELLSLESRPNETLPEKFTSDVKCMTTFLRGVGPKLVNNASKQCWHGNTFKSFLDEYIKQIAKGEKMDFASSMTQWAITSNEQLKDTVCREYQSMLDILPKECNGNPSEYAMQCMFKSVKRFNKEAYPLYADKIESKASDKLQCMMQSFLFENKLKVKNLCSDYLNNGHEEMLKKNRTEYDGSDGFRKYDADLQELIQTFKNKFYNYDKEGKLEALQELNEKIHKDHQKKVLDELQKQEVEIESQRHKLEKMKRKMEGEANDSKKEMHKKVLKEYKEYVKNLSSKGVWERLKYLFTARIDP